MGGIIFGMIVIIGGALFSFAENLIDVMCFFGKS